MTSYVFVIFVTYYLLDVLRGQQIKHCFYFRKSLFFPKSSFSAVPQKQKRKVGHTYRLDGQKCTFSRCKSHVQGTQKEVQGPQDFQKL